MTADRRRARRRTLGRRRADVWGSLGKTAGLLASVAGALYGQGEMIGEPWRHIISIVFIASTAAFGFLLGPQHVKLLLGAIRNRP